MAKITDLAVVDAITGDEFLPIVQRGATKRATMTALRALIVPFLQNWYKGDPGGPGPSNNTRLTLANLKAAATTDMTSLYDGSLWTWTPGDFSATPAARLDRDIVKAATRPLAEGAWVRPQRSLYAGDFGVRGDRFTDDTAALRNVIAIAKALGIGIVRLGYLQCRVTGPIVCDGVALVADKQGFGLEDAGLYPEGSGYTVVTVRGFVSDFVCGIYSPGRVTFDKNNNVLSDTRPDLTGIQISGDVHNGVCALSYYRWIRVLGLRRGALISTLWDTTIEKMSVEYCGGTGTEDYAVDIEDGEPGQTTNESVIHHLHVEHSIHRAIRVTGNLLSCAIHKIHSERAYAVPGVTTWQLLGGGCDYGPARLNASVNGNPNAPKGAAVIGGAGTVFRSTRIEDAMASYSVLQNGTVTLIEPYMALTAAQGQNGALTVIGGVVAGEAIDGYATFYGTSFPTLSIGFAAPDAATKLVGCRIASLIAASNQAAIDLHDCGPVPIDPLMFRSIRALGATELRPVSGNTLSFGYQYLLLDTSARIAANAAIDFCGFDWRGTIAGTVTFTTAMRTVICADAKATGAVTGYAPPAGAEYIGPRVNAERTKNPGWMPGAPPGWLYAAADAAWHPEPTVV